MLAAPHGRRRTASADRLPDAAARSQSAAGSSYSMTVEDATLPWGGCLAELCSPERPLAPLRVRFHPVGRTVGRLNERPSARSIDPGETWVAYQLRSRSRWPHRSAAVGTPRSPFSFPVGASKRRSVVESLLTANRATLSPPPLPPPPRLPSSPPPSPLEERA